MARKRFTERQALEVAILQGGIVPCYRCKIAFTVDTIRTAEREHVHEVILGGPDTVANCAYSCRDCHSVVTNGNGATSAGSSKHKAAKIRVKHTAKFVVNKLPTGTRTAKPPARAMRSRKFPTQQRGFAPRGARPMNKRRRA